MRKTFFKIEKKKMFNTREKAFDIRLINNVTIDAIIPILEY